VSLAIRELTGLRVSLDRLELAPAFDGAPAKTHAFVYHITIHNESDETVTIKGRKWVVRDAAGEVLAYEGDGVVGEFPRIAPGERFHYSSYHLVGSDSRAEGAYLAVSDAGEAVLARIPPFRMEIPADSQA